MWSSQRLTFHNVYFVSTEDINGDIIANLEAQGASWEDLCRPDRAGLPIEKPIKDFICCSHFCICLKQCVLLLFNVHGVVRYTFCHKRLACAEGMHPNETRDFVEGLCICAGNMTLLLIDNGREFSSGNSVFWRAMAHLQDPLNNRHTLRVIIGYNNGPWPAAPG